MNNKFWRGQLYFGSCSCHWVKGFQRLETMYLCHPQVSKRPRRPMKMRHGTSTRKVVNQLSCDEGTCAKGTETAVTRRPQLHGNISYRKTSVTRSRQLDGDLSYTET